MLFGPDHCQYESTEKTKHCVLVLGQFPLMQYQHEEWEKTIMDAEQSSSPAAKAAVPQHHSSSMARGTPVTAATTTQQISRISDTTPPVPLQQHNSDVTEEPPGAAATAAATPQLSTATAAGQQHNNNSCHSEMLRLENLNLLSRRERAALAFPKVASILPEDIVLAQVQTEVNNPLLLNLRPSDSAVEHAFKLLGEVSKSTYKSEKVIVDSDDDGEEDQATVTIGRLGTFSRIHFVFFRQYAILLQKLLE